MSAAEANRINACFARLIYHPNLRNVALVAESDGFIHRALRMVKQVPAGELAVIFSETGNKNISVYGTG